MDRFAIVAAPVPARRVSKKSDPGLGRHSTEEGGNVVKARHEGCPQRR